MKALIQIASNPGLFEIFLERDWHDWIDKESGAPLTDENYGYAMCYEFPIEDLSVAEADDFSITVTEKKEIGLDGDEVVRTYKIAEYHPANHTESASD